MTLRMADLCEDGSTREMIFKSPSRSKSADDMNSSTTPKGKLVSPKTKNLQPVDSPKPSGRIATSPKFNTTVTLPASQRTSSTPRPNVNHRWTHAADTCGNVNGRAECYVHRSVNDGSREKDTILKQRDLNKLGFDSWLCSKAWKHEKWRAGCIACVAAYVKLLRA